MSLKDLIKKKNQRLQSIPDALLSVVEKTQKQIYSEIISLLDKLERTGGAITVSEQNLLIMSEIMDDLKKVLFESDYPDAVKDFAKEFDVQKKVNDDYFNKAFETEADKTVAEALVKKAKADAVQALLDSPLDDNFLKPIENILIDSIATGSGFTETLKAIQDFVEGSDDKDGKLLSYSKQIAHDDFAFSDRSYANAISDDLEVEWYYYSGGTLDTTRCFCKERHEKYFHYKEIQAWGEGKDLGECRSGDLWQGAVPSTNAQTIFIYAGGFGCIHSIMPVSVFQVPKDVIQRNIANGNYEPSDKELELLQL